MFTLEHTHNSTKIKSLNVTSRRTCGYYRLRKEIVRGLGAVTWLWLGVCKKPTNRKNRFKLTEPLQKSRLSSVSVLLHKKLKILVRFSVTDLNASNRLNQIEIYYYIIILYFILNIHSIKFVTWAWAWPCLNYSSPLPLFLERSPLPIG